MLRHRSGSLAVLAALVLAACSQSKSAPAVAGGRTSGRTPVATFKGEFDPATGKMTIVTAPSAEPGALTEYLPWQDNVPGSGPVNTFELVTEAAPEPGYVSSGCSPGVDSWEGAITVRSFFRNQTFQKVYAELLTVSSGHEGCNSAADPYFLASTNGLWSYGDIAPGGHATQTWKFRYMNSERFTFTGRIMADLGAPTALGPEFDWAPVALVNPPRSFQDVGTTLFHLVWNGTSFVDTAGVVTMLPQGSPVSVAPALPTVPQPYVGGFSATTRFVADAAHGADAFNLSGNFTTCVKFKPGAHPGHGNPLNKILFAKGDARADHEGWAVMQMHEGYCFHYRTPEDNLAGSGDRMSNVAVSGDPSLNTYDYICGGRNGTDLLDSAHGELGGMTGGSAVETGTFTNAGLGLPLVIGSYPDGSEPAFDAGVYEVIVDSRAVTLDVMREIVAAAEGRPLAGTVAGSQTFLPANTTPTTVTGADGGSYVEPPYATIPLPSDGSGLLGEGTMLAYTHPLHDDTRNTGFCVGAVVKADAQWSAVTGTFFTYDNAAFKLLIEGATAGLWWQGWNAWVLDGGATERAWADGSEHTVHVCADPLGVGSMSTASMYLDGVQVGTGVSVGPDSVPNFSAAAAKASIGGDAFNPALAGARIRRLFVCPSPTAATCQ